MIERNIIAAFYKISKLNSIGSGCVRIKCKWLPSQYKRYKSVGTKLCVTFSGILAGYLGGLGKKKNRHSPLAASSSTCCPSLHTQIGRLLLYSFFRCLKSHVSTTSNKTMHSFLHDSIVGNFFGYQPRDRPHIVVPHSLVQLSDSAEHCDVLRCVYEKNRYSLLKPTSANNPTGH